MNTQQKIIKAVVVIGVLLLLFLLRDWITPTIVKSLGGYTQKDVTSRIDTLQSRFDTIRADYETRILNLKISKRKVDTTYIYKYKTETVTEKGDTVYIDTWEHRDSVYVYNNAVEDSIIKGNIHTVVDAKNANMLEQNLEYKPKIPIIVKEYIPIKETITETLTNEDKPKVGIGIETSTLQGVGPSILYQTKDGWQFNAGYEHFLNETVLFGNNKVDGAFKIGIYKTF